MTAREAIALVCDDFTEHEVAELPRTGDGPPPQPSAREVPPAGRGTAPRARWRRGDFSVIAPELAAAILKRAPTRIPHTATQLRLRPEDLTQLGVIRGIVGAADRV